MCVFWIIQTMLKISFFFQGSIKRRRAKNTKSFSSKKYQIEPKKYKTILYTAKRVKNETLFGIIFKHFLFLKNFY